MKKEILIIVGIIAVIITAHAVSQVYTQNFFESICNDLDKIEEKIISDDYENEETSADIEDVINKWNSKYDIFACYIEHDELEKVKTQLISIKANIKVDDFDKSVDEIEKCKFILKHIEEKDSLKFVNIL